MSKLESPDEPGSSRHYGDDLEAFKKHHSTDVFYVQECDVGLGIFARREIWPGEMILEIEGPLIDFAETKRRGPRECMAIQIGFNRYVDTQPPGVLVNHSCEPNAGIRSNKHMVALSRIGKDEEIRFDYSTTMEEQSFTMECRCGVPTCRGIVRDFSTLALSTQSAYIGAGIVMEFIVARTLAKRTLELSAVQTPARRPQAALQL